jgi:addiction module HigA family antidote
MPLYPAIRDPNRAPAHPGALLPNIIEATGKSKAEIARLLGISRKMLYDIMDEKKPVSPPMAVRLGKLFGNGPGLWIRMQAARDEWNATREVDVSGIETLRAKEDA